MFRQPWDDKCLPSLEHRGLFPGTLGAAINLNLRYGTKHLQNDPIKFGRCQFVQTNSWVFLLRLAGSISSETFHDFDTFPADN